MNYDRRNEINFYKKLSIILGTILAIIVVSLGVIFYFDQWNLHGVSNMPHFDWTKDRSLDLVGKVEGKSVYKYGISEMTYSTFSANKITAKKYYEQSWVTVDMLTASGLEERDIEYISMIVTIYCLQIRLLYFVAMMYRLKRLYNPLESKTLIAAYVNLC